MHDVTDTSEVTDGSIPAYTTAGRARYVIVATAVILAFFAAYGYAMSRNAPTDAAALTAISADASCATGAGCGSEGAACGSQGSACGSGGSTPADAPEGVTTIEGDVQRIAVDVSAGYFNPTVIRATAGIPVEITFGQGSGCLAEVVIPEFDVNENLTRGGAVVTLPAPQPGEYGFTCGMSMVFGSIVVE